MRESRVALARVARRAGWHRPWRKSTGGAQTRSAQNGWRQVTAVPAGLYQHGRQRWHGGSSSTRVVEYLQIAAFARSRHHYLCTFSRFTGATCATPILKPFRLDRHGRLLGRVERRRNRCRRIGPSYPRALRAKADRYALPALSVVIRAGVGVLALVS